MKAARHAMILELIEKNDIETQEELAAYLRKHNYDVTQATVSRDIKELRLIKALTDNGTYKYATVVAEQAYRSVLSVFFSQSVSGHHGSRAHHRYQNDHRQRVCGGRSGGFVKMEMRKAGLLRETTTIFICRLKKPKIGSELIKAISGFAQIEVNSMLKALMPSKMWHLIDLAGCLNSKRFSCITGKTGGWQFPSSRV